MPQSFWTGIDVCHWRLRQCRESVEEYGRTNGSYIQEKSAAVVWHYENADPRYGDMQLYPFESDCWAQWVGLGSDQCFSELLSNGQSRNDMIVSTNVSYGGEYEYLVVMVHEFVINNCANKQVKHPIILMIDLRNISFNVSYDKCDRDNNHRNVFGIKCFYGFKQDRFKLQCGFGGFKLPPLSTQSYAYVQSKYRNGQTLRKNESVLRRERQRELKRKLGLTNANVNKKANSKRGKSRRHSQSQSLNNGVQFKLNKNELRNLRIPFVQSLESASLSGLQNEINQRVDTHYSHASTHIRKKKSKKKARNNKKCEIIITENKSNNNSKESMIETMTNIALKYPKFLPSKISQDLECNISECMLSNLFHTLPNNVLHKVKS